MPTVRDVSLFAITAVREKRNVPKSLTWLLVMCSIGLFGFDAPRDTQGIGVLVLAHGGSARWNRLVQETVEQAKLGHPTAIAFGMGMHPHEVRGLQQAIDTLEARGVDRIIIVPLLVSSASEVMRQFQYLLGVHDHGPWEDHTKPVSLRVPVIITQPLDDDPVVAEVLFDRARELSHAPQEETVVVVAHGPISDEDNAHWLAAMGRVAKQIQEMGHFRAVIPVTMRDDASKPVRDAAIRQMRAIIREQSQQGRTLVVPRLLANGGIESMIPKRLNRLHYVYRGRTLLPHAKLAQWIAHQVATATLSAPRTDARAAMDRPEPAHVQ